MHQVWDGVKVAPADAIAGDQTQPNLHLVQPGGISEGEVEVHVGVLLLPGTHERSFVHRQVVQDVVNDFSLMSANGLHQEFNKLEAGVSGGAASEHLPTRHLQRGEQRDRTTADVLDGARLRLAPAHCGLNWNAIKLPAWRQARTTR